MTALDRLTDGWSASIEWHCWVQCSPRSRVLLTFPEVNRFPFVNICKAKSFRQISNYLSA